MPRKLRGSLGMIAVVSSLLIGCEPNGSVSPTDEASPTGATTTDASPELGIAGMAGDPLGWFRDRTRLVVLHGGLFILAADGSQTQVAEGLFGFQGATISPDGARVVFVSGTDMADGGCCAAFALYAVDVSGGTPEVLLEPDDAMVEEPTFSPDGTRIAYVVGSGDHGHHVWVMDADGANRHQVLANDVTLGVGHVRGLAWSPAGDRMALKLEDRIYTFASDGSDFALAGHAAISSWRRHA